MAGDAIIATLVLGGMCGLMWWLARLAKKRMGVGAGTVSASGLRVVGKRPLDQKSALYVVEIAGGRHILLGSSIEGSVTKLDDISPEEFAIMTADEPAAPKLRVARAVPSDAGEPSGDDEAADEATPQFASVGESFHHFLGKARQSRAARRSAASDDAPDQRASGE